MEFFDDIEAGAAEERGDSWLVEAGGVVLDADGAFLFLEQNAADAVDLAEIVKGAHFGLSGGLPISKHNVNARHFGSRFMIASGESDQAPRCGPDNCWVPL